MPASHSLAATAIALAVAAALSACGSGGNSNDAAPPAPVATLGDAIALTASGKLVSFDRAAPATLRSSVAITGLSSGETLLGIDRRPADGLLYALGSTGRIYTLDAATGVASFKAALAPAAGDDNPFSALAGSRFGLDFNPVADRLRVTSDSGQNLRINVESGAAITDGAVNGVSGAAVSASAYSNSFAGTTATQLYVLDAATGTLFLQDPPNAGTLAAPIALGMSFAAANGFDIDARDNSGWAALTATAGGASTLYKLSVTAGGGATMIGAIGGGEAIVGLALTQPARPVVHALAADGQLVSVDPAAPNTVLGTVAVGGLASTERLLGIDFRPKDGQLWGLTSAARLVTLDPATGAATIVATLGADAADATAPFAGLTGSLFTVDFNPVADRLRVITDTGLNLRINVDTGATTTDGAINRAGVAPTVAGGAYGNSFGGATATMLFDIDAASAVLALQSPPNDGTLTDIGALGVVPVGAAPMDIAGGANGLVLAALASSAGGPSRLVNVALATGAATPRVAGDAALSLIGGAGGPAIVDIAIKL